MIRNWIAAFLWLTAVLAIGVAGLAQYSAMETVRQRLNEEVAQLEQQTHPQPAQKPFATQSN